MQVIDINSNINFGQAKVVKKIVKSQHLETIFNKKLQKYPEDYKYFKLLGKKLGLTEKNLYKLNSIVGPHELEIILQNANYNSFNPGNNLIHGKLSVHNFEELAERGFSYNLHMHTTYSDGKMSIKSLLDQAAKYADILYAKTSKRFIIAITDHDTLEGNKKALEIIAKNPDKYKNLGVVLGAELSALYKEHKMLAKPFAYEMIAYAVNPFDAVLNTNLANLRQNRIKLSKKIIKDASKIYPNFEFSYKEMCKSYKNPKKGIDGFLYAIADYLEAKTGNLPNIRDLSLQYMPKVNEKSNGIVNVAENIFQHAKKQLGFFGIAHPGKIYLGSGKISNDFIKQCKLENKSAGKVIIDTFLEYLKKFGKGKLKAIETNYQSYDGTLNAAQEALNNPSVIPDKSLEGSMKWLDNFREFSRKNNLLNTGGLDTHSENPFLRK